MRNLLAVILSIIIHLAFLYNLLNIELDIDKLEEKESINIKIIKTEKKLKSGEQFNKGEYNALETTAVETNILKPQKSVNRDVMEFTPVIENNESLLFANTISSREAEQMTFQSSLESLIPQVQVELEDTSQEGISISWGGDEREVENINYIDFNKFPKESFTGVGLNVEFSVTSRGDVYDVKIVPPGSGSIEFDILVIEYVSDFKFKPGNSISNGEIKIVYEK